MADSHLRQSWFGGRPTCTYHCQVHPARVVVLLSGTGSLAAALIQAADRPVAPFDVVALVSDRNAPGLEHAADANIDSLVVDPSDYADREAWDRALAEKIASLEPDLVVSAGFMRLLGASVLGAFPNRIVNSHPALLPSFPGAHAVRDALAYGVTVTGTTVHLVDAGVDTGPIIAQEPVEVLPDDDEASLHERIKTVERWLLADVVTALSIGSMKIVDRKVILT